MKDVKLISIILVSLGLLYLNNQMWIYFLGDLVSDTDLMMLTIGSLVLTLFCVAGLILVALGYSIVRKYM